MALSQGVMVKGRGRGHTAGSEGDPDTHRHTHTYIRTHTFLCQPVSLYSSSQNLSDISLLLLFHQSLVSPSLPFFPSLSLYRDGPNLSTTRPIQKSLCRQDSQYSEDMDNVMNSKLATSQPQLPPGSTQQPCPASGLPSPANHITPGPGFGPAGLNTHLTNSSSHLGPDGSLVPAYGSSTRIPDHTAVDIPPMFPSHNAILQGEREGRKRRGGGWRETVYDQGLSGHIFSQNIEKQPHMPCYF